MKTIIHYLFPNDWQDEMKSTSKPLPHPSMVSLKGGKAKNYHSEIAIDRRVQENR